MQNQPLADWRLSQMSFDDFLNMLRGLAPQQAVHISYNLFADWFPPGVEDDNGLIAARLVALENDCVIDNHPELSEVLFVKN
jgi:hypothetical protein